MAETQKPKKPEADEAEKVSKQDGCQISEFRYGQPCPVCGSNDVGYNGLLNLVCRNCGLRQAGVFT